MVMDEVLPEGLISRIRTLAGEGALSKACKHLLSNGLADPGHAGVARRLQDLHPCSPLPDTQSLATDSLPRFAWDLS